MPKSIRRENETQPPDTPVNVFVLGDLVVDHFIPIVDKTTPYQSVGNEHVVNGLPRRTIAGGAANSARQIAALSEGGRTCLWGPSGYSPWGSFLQLLQRSQNIDGVDHPITYLGCHNEALTTNTITRIVRISSGQKISREYRIDDVRNVPVSDAQIGDLLNHIRNEHAQSRIQAFLLNDLNMRALNAQLVLEISKFAEQHEIPVLVDPKRDWTVYRSIPVVCALPNLNEWCHIVKDVGNEPRWRNDLNNPDTLRDMAARSILHLPHAVFHIIKCDKDGAVFVGPDGPGQRLVCHLKPAPGQIGDPTNQIGTGDVLAGALAVEIARLARPDGLRSEAVLGALTRAFEVVACYLRLDWQRVPNKRELANFEPPKLNISSRTKLADGLLLLPSADNPIDLAEMSIKNSSLVSRDAEYRSTIDALIEHFQTGWDGAAAKSAILTGRGGVGKSEIIGLLSEELGQCRVLEWRAADFSKKSCPTVDAAVEKIRAQRDAERADAAAREKLVIVVDEAFAKVGHLTFGRAGKMLLQLAGEECGPVRFLFVDASFEAYRKKFEASQFLSRCEIFELPELAKRRYDIPYIFAAACIKSDRKTRASTMGTVEISERALLGVINWVLQTSREDQSPRKIFQVAAKTVQKARADAPNDSVLKISLRHLSADLRKVVGPWHPPKRYVTFVWGR